jgi:hypothetical protein
MTLCIVTSSTDREWVRAISGLRRRGVGVVVVLLDRFSFASHRGAPEHAPGSKPADAVRPSDAIRPPPDAIRPTDVAEPPADAAGLAELAACRHALAEYDIVTHLLHAGDDLSSVLGERSRVRA